ncbi:MAG: S41 family peptidase [Gemmatimonadetes bacterium]|nr:S41 family peptidase [Gemmatimonadota bacterium]
MSTLRISLLLALVAFTSDLQAERSIEDEYKALLWKTAHRIHHYYFEEVHPDSLMQAAARGIFHALDPASEYTFNARTQLDDADAAKLDQRFYTLMQMAQAIDENAFYPVAADTLIRFGIAGMMEILDPYSVFLEKRNLDNFNIQTQGKYGGLGFRIQVVYPDSAIAVWSLLHDQTPAALAGVKSGDLITTINNTSTKSMSAGVAADSMRGEPGTPVTLTLKRADRPTPFDLTIERQEVQMNSVTLATLFPDDTGYIKLHSFQKGSSREMFNAIVGLEEQGMQRLIFDLRGNGGGYLEEAVQVADHFLPRNRLVVFTAGRAFEDTVRYETSEDALLRDTPLIVLVNHLSASASEIVAGAIQDWDRGLVLGDTTVGKGSVQQIVHIDDRTELKLTMAAWHTPSGRSIDKRMRKDSTLVRGYDKAFKTLRLERIVRGGGGITPDIVVPGRSGNRLYAQLSGIYSLNNQFFYYAREHRLKYPKLTPDFVAGPEDLAAFRAFAENRGFNYISELEARVEELDKVAVGEEYNQLAKPLSHLSDEIEKIEEKHWQENEDLISWRLTFDVLEKAFGQQVAEAYNVTVDPQVLEAHRIIADPSEYQMWFDKGEIGVLEEESIAQEDGRGDLQ